MTTETLNRIKGDGRMMKILTLLLAALTFGAVVSTHIVVTDRAMTVCLKNHSEGYCVEALN